MTDASKPDASKPATKAAKAAGTQDTPRAAPQSIDLPKSAVKDITPPAPEAAKADSAPKTDSATKAEDTAKTESLAKEPARPNPTSSEVKPDTKKADAAPSSKGGVIGGAVAGGIFGLIAAVAYPTLQAPPVTVADPKIAALETALAGLEKKAANPAGLDPLAAALKALEGRAAALESQLAAVDRKAGAPVPGLDDRFKALEGRVKEAQDQAAAAVGKLAEAPIPTPAPATSSGSAAPAPTIDLAPVTARIAKLEQAITDAAGKATNAERKAAATTEAVDPRLATLEKAVSDLKAPKAGESAGAILAITTMARRALDSGQPLARLTAALTALGAPAEPLRALSVLGDRPAPRPAQLADMLADLAAKLPKPAAPEKPKDASLTEQIKTRFVGLVEVRPAGQPKQPDAAGIAGLARPKLMADDIEGAVALVKALPEDQQGGLKAFVDAAGQRLAVIKALAALEGEALQAAGRKN